MHDNVQLMLVKLRLKADMPYVALDMLKEVWLDLVLVYYLKMYVSFRLLMENKNMPSLAQYRVLLF